jgi:hypothetical protein
MKTIWYAVLLSALVIALSSCKPSLTAGTPAHPLPAHAPLVDTNSLADWGQSRAAQNVQDFAVSLAQGTADNSIQILYNLDRGGWVSIWKSLDPQLLSNTGGISFYYMGSGASNTVQFKLRLLYPDDTEETYFYASQQLHTNTGGKWKLVKVPYSSFSCVHPTAQCANHRTGFFHSLDPAKVVKIDLAIANTSGDKAGQGVVTFDDIAGMSKFAALLTTDGLVRLLGVIILIPLLAFILYSLFFGKSPWITMFEKGYPLDKV